MLARPLKPGSSMQVASEVLRQHSELVAFLWAQRDTLLAEDPPDLKVADEIRSRIEVNLDGLRLAGTEAWPFIVEQHRSFPEKGELFAYSWMAIERGDRQRISETVDFGRATDDDASGLIGALAWHDPHAIASLVRDWIGAPDAFKRFLGVSACLAHDVDPKQMLVRLVRDSDPKVRTVSLRLAGKLKRSDLEQDMYGALQANNSAIRLWGAWALTEIGSGNLGGPELRKLAIAGGPDAPLALRAAIKAGSDKEVRRWMGGLMRSLQTAPLAVRGIGMVGDRSALGWLVQQMSQPTLAVAATAAFLELFPEARRESKLFSDDPDNVSAAFIEHFGDDPVTLAVAERVEAWGRSQKLIQ